MKIKEFLVTRYGPISHKNKISLTNFNLIWGKNEEGKTLTIDALVKLLLGRNIRDFEHINRVDENPEGYVIIENDKGEEIKLPEKGDLTKFLDLTPSECCNIFIVRNSNLSIARDVAQEGKFYTNVTDRLTGLRTKEISKIKETLREIGKITPTGIFSDTIKDEKLKTRIDDAKDLIGKIESLAKEIKDERFDELEEESAKQREKLSGIEQKIKNLEDARKREEYGKGREALDKLINSQEKYKQLEIYNENDEQLWRDCEKNLKTFDEDKKKILVELKKNEGELKEITEKLGNAERDFKVFDDRKKKIDDEVKPELKNYEMSVGKVKSEETKNKFYTKATTTSVVLLSLSILGAIIKTSFIFYTLILFFLILTALFAMLRFSFTQKEAHLAAVFARIRFITSKLELDAESPKKIYLNIQKFDEEHQKRYDELQAIKRRKENLDDKIEELQNRTIP
ncbi:MAG: AAA family ATPase, partial [Caldisericaceae bacterium]|nr:AAA family ATPase [Caldisericaceae bacterium]